MTQNSNTLSLSNERLVDKKLELLQAEMGIIQSSVGDTVDSLWKIRSLSLTLWTAVLSLGLGGFSGGLQNIPILLVLSGFIPILSAWIDSSYNIWYRRLSARERIIRDFINDTDFILPSTRQHVTLSSILDGAPFVFPVYDLPGNKSYGNHPSFRWDCSRLRSLIDRTPFFIYSSQLILTGIILSIHGPVVLRGYYLAIALGIPIILYVVGIYQKNVMLKKADDFNIKQSN